MTLPIALMKCGDVRVGRRRKLTMARALALSGGPFDKTGWPDKNLHTDADAAAATGLSEVVVSGTQWEGYLVGLLVETMGQAWFEGGRLDVKIPRSVRIGEAVQPKLRLDAVVPHQDSSLAELSVWCENAEGQLVLVGTASCLMPAGWRVA